MTNPYTDYNKTLGGSGDGLFFRPTPGSTTKLRIFSLAHVGTTEYEGESKDQYSWVVWNYDEEKAQILAKGRSVFSQIVELSQDTDWGDPTTYDIKFTRTGEGMDTRYTIIPSPAKGTLTEAQVEELEKIDVAKITKSLPIDQALIDADNNKSGIEEMFKK